MTATIAENTAWERDDNGVWRVRDLNDGNRLVAGSSLLQIYVVAETYHESVGQYTTFVTGPYPSEQAACIAFRAWEKFDHEADGITDVQWDVRRMTYEDAHSYEEVYEAKVTVDLPKTFVHWFERLLGNEPLERKAVLSRKYRLDLTLAQVRGLMFDATYCLGSAGVRQSAAAAVRALQATGWAE